MKVDSNVVYEQIKKEIKEKYKRDIDVLDCIGSIESIVTHRLSSTVHSFFDGRDTDQLLHHLGGFTLRYTEEVLAEIEQHIQDTEKAIKLKTGRIYITEIERKTHKLYQELGFIDHTAANDIFKRVEPLKAAIRATEAAKKGLKGIEGGKGKDKGKK